ncbi:MAG TPA: serine hydrolase domain-containing protein [Candidatus Angelobacter sp.]|nr:serine hydrolase domain-containing protein [Candidatus Angelobacter sp.]
MQPGIHTNPTANRLLSYDLATQDEKFARAFAILDSGVQQKAFPGAAVAVAHHGKLVGLKGLGHFTYDANSRAVGPRTIYDLASLTKVVATTAVCMRLYDRKQFHLEKRVLDVVPEFAGSDPRRSQVTLRMLLAHSSGLPAYVKLFETAKNQDELRAKAFQIPLVADPGAHAEYSDIGFILLGVALERITSEPLDTLCDREIFRPLDLSLGFHPEKTLEASIPPTENDMRFRRRVIQGEVNDENAWVMGGVAGHAGCFGAAESVATLAQCLLNGGAPLFQTHTVELFTRRENFPAGTSRALGWDTPSPPSQSGKYFSPKSYGHLGYTGTSLWIDPEQQLSVTLLTNRTWPDRSSQGIKEVRPAFHDAVVQALDEGSGI